MKLKGKFKEANYRLLTKASPQFGKSLLYKQPRRMLWEGYQYMFALSLYFSKGTSFEWPRMVQLQSDLGLSLLYS